VRRHLAVLIGCSAAYGLSVGLAHSWLAALRNVVKVPLLLLITAAVCALAYHVIASFAGAGLKFAAVQQMSLLLFRDVSVLLASLAPVGLFLSLALERPTERGLAEYPLFLGFNVAVVGGCGAVALWRQASRVVQASALSRRRGAAVVGAWLLVSLAVGGQVAWFLRPFFGVATIRAEDTPFFLGSRPDFRGATSFYEALLHLASPPKAAHVGQTAAGGVDPERVENAGEDVGLVRGLLAWRGGAGLGVEAVGQSSVGVDAAQHPPAVQQR
jgi:hypothetical protein